MLDLWLLEGGRDSREGLLVRIFGAAAAVDVDSAGLFAETLGLTDGSTPPLTAEPI